MKIDIVNPTPAKNPIPNICLKFTPSGNSSNFNFTPKKDANVTPIKFPTTKQITIFDIQGRLVFSSVESIPARITPDIESSGMFIIEVKNSDYTYRSRIIKY